MRKSTKNIFPPIIFPIETDSCSLSGFFYHRKEKNQHRFIIFTELSKVELKKNKKKGKPLHNTDFYTNFAKNKLAGFKSKAKNKNHKYQKNDKER
jgi:hypothetical protein